MKKNTPQSSALVDEEYKSAIQPVVDNNMRTDILGPHFCKVLNDHTPASEAVIGLVTKEVIRDSNLKKSIKEVVSEVNRETKMQWFDRMLGVIGTIVVGLIIWGLQRFLSSIPAR